MLQQRKREAFEFYGSWREYAPIAFTNLLLTIVTLGLYSFWARTRTRHYLWSNTRFIDDRLEWVGTGRELFFGYLLVMVLVFVPVAAMNLLVGLLVAQGSIFGAVAGSLLFLLLYLFLFALAGVAIFRALRYRLSRTFWHGIRGGTDDQGFRYGISYMWRTIAGSFVFGLLIPWSMVSLWNKRWNAMSFGPHPFQSTAGLDEKLMLRFLLLYILPIALVVGTIATVFIGYLSGNSMQDHPVLLTILGLAPFFLLFGMSLIGVGYYAAYFRHMIGGMSLAGLEFEFTASAWDWLKLMLGSFALVVGTLGIGAIFLGYRNWAFFVRHLRAYGTLALDQLTQSTTRAPRQGEGLFDSLDMGAF
jgi:uncharacterized membrane protein YjgN (DUF898 family)